MQRLILTFALLVFICAPCVAHRAVDDAVSEVPFVFEKGYVVVQARIKGDKPVDVIIATGSEHSQVDGLLLEKYKLPAYYSAEGPITGRNDRLYTFSTVSDIRLGNIKLTSLNMRLGSFVEFSKRLGREIFGIFGADFFRGRVAQFDFGKKLLRFLPQSTAEASKDKKAGDDAGGRIVLPMDFYKENVTLPIAEDVTFEGKKIKTLLDTGAVTVVSLSSSATKQVGLTPPPEKGEPRADKINSLRLGSFEINGVPVTLYPKGSDFDRDQKEFGAVAGTLLLQNFVVTFDFRSKVIILEHL